MRITLRILSLILVFSFVAQHTLGQSGDLDAAGQDSLYFNLFHDIQVGPGLATFMGPMDGNPENDPIHFASRVNPSFFVSAMRVVGSGISIGTDISYERLSGVRSRDRVDGQPITFRFSNNVVSANLLASYEFSFVPEGYFKIFVGGGTSLLLNPQYDFDGLTTEDLPGDFGQLRPDLGTRPVISLTGGFLLFNQLRIGYRMPLTNYVDGWEGFPGADRIIPYDMIMYVQFGFTVEQLTTAFDTAFRF